MQWVAWQELNPQLGNPNPLQWSMSRPALCSGGKCSIFHDCFSCKHPWKATPKQRKSVPLLMRCVEKWESSAETVLKKRGVYAHCGFSIPFPLLSLGHHVTQNVVVLTASSFCSQTGLGIMLGIFIFADSEHLRFPGDLCNQERWQIN